MALINRPDLEIRNEDELAAQAIGRVTGAHSLELIDGYIAKLGELRKLVSAGNLVAICPELTNANPSAPHTVLLESLAWQLAQVSYRINQIPDQNLVEFARLFNIEQRAATEAATILRFTAAESAPLPVTVPAGTRVSTADETIIFETIESLILTNDATTGETAARNNTTGHTQLAPNRLNTFVDNVSFVAAVTNPSAVDAGNELESITSALERMRSLQRRTERIVSNIDLEEAILQDVLNNSGIVRAFPMVAGSFLDPLKPGHTTVIVATAAGDPVDALVRRKIGALIDRQVVGNQFVYVIDPINVPFDVVASVTLSNAGSGVAALIENSLRKFYAPSRTKFGRAILRSDIISIIEDTPGVESIAAANSSGAILAAPLADTKVSPWGLPRLESVTINYV